MAARRYNENSSTRKLVDPNIRQQNIRQPTTYVEISSTQTFVDLNNHQPH
jgi:hypothetical protein